MRTRLISAGARHILFLLLSLGCLCVVQAHNPSRSDYLSCIINELDRRAQIVHVRHGRCQVTCELEFLIRTFTPTPM